MTNTQTNPSRTPDTGLDEDQLPQNQSEPKEMDQQKKEDAARKQAQHQQPHKK